MHKKTGLNKQKREGKGKETRIGRLLPPLGHAVGVDDEPLALPHTAGDPQTAVNDLGVALVGSLDGQEHAKAILARVDLLGAAGAQEGVEDITGTGQGAAGAHLETIRASAASPLLGTS